MLTLLVHLGYLTYCGNTGTVKIPNEEVRNEFRNFIGNDRFGQKWIKLLYRSGSLLQSAIQGEEETVAAILDEIRQEQYAPSFYNNEQALRAIIKYAFISAIGQYSKIEEMPSGKGIADVVFIPAAFSKLPPMVVELKWNKTAGGAISQIRNRKYAAVLSPYVGNILLVGINYSEKTGMHSCRIERA